MRIKEHVGQILLVEDGSLSEERTESRLCRGGASRCGAGKFQPEALVMTASRGPKAYRAWFINSLSDPLICSLNGHGSEINRFSGSTNPPLSRGFAENMRVY